MMLEDKLVLKKDPKTYKILLLEVRLRLGRIKDCSNGRVPEQSVNSQMAKFSHLFRLNLRKKVT
jgi:hypothetical protein